jgi:membrane protein DedA with SNARE-associated domain
MAELLKSITHGLEIFISNNGLWAVFLLMTAESALIPIPSEVTMCFAGFMAGLGVLSFWPVVIIGALGNLVGSWLAYWLGYKKGEEWVRIAIRKWGKWFLLKEEEYDKSKVWFSKYGQGITFASRLLPIVRTFISLPAGIAKMNLPLFSVLTFIGSFAWSAFLAFLGLKLGENWTAVEPYFRKFQFVVIGLFVAAVVFYIYSHLKKNKHSHA